MKTVNWKKLLLSLVVSLGAGGLAGFLTKNSMNAFRLLRKPPLSPPGILFPIVWTILYVLMGISAYLVSMSGSFETRRALILYAVQLAVNFFWSLIFFNAGNYLFAFLWLLLLWVLVFAMLLSFRKADRTAALLQIPYFLWVTFAAYLNCGIWLLNR